MLVNNKREGLSIMSTLTNQGKVRWKVFEGAVNADILIDLFKRLIKDADRQVFLILDNLKVHHARRVKDWLVDHEEEIEVFYLPSYSRGLIRLCQIPLFVNSLSRCLFSVLRLDGCLTFSMSFLHLPDNLSMRHIASWQKGTQE